MLVDEVEGEIIEAEVEETNQRRVLPTPDLPSQSDQEKHREDHLPYASWCDHCVEGRGREMGHHATHSGAKSVPTISFDYMFMNSKGEACDEITDDGADVHKDGIKVLVVKDSKSKAIFAHVVPSKGVDDK